MRTEFYRNVRMCYGQTEAVLLRIIRDRPGRSPRFRAAALRNLICDASLEVTQGQPYLQRRRLVREHYRV